MCHDATGFKHANVDHAHFMAVSGAMNKLCKKFNSDGPQPSEDATALYDAVAEMLQDAGGSQDWLDRSR